MNSRSLILSRELEHYTLYAVDGEIGTIEYFYFDDVSWVIRYLVVNTGNWISGKRVLISPVAIGQVKKSRNELHIELTREQIKNSPSIEKDETILRHYEEEYYQYYGWPPYWEAGPFSAPEHLDVMKPPSDPPKSAKSEPKDYHLRNSEDVKGYEIVSLNGSTGKVEDFVIDTQYWLLRYVVINTAKWHQGVYSLMSPDCISRVSWAMKEVYVNLTHEMIEAAPEFDPEREIREDYQDRILQYYKQCKS